MSLNKKQAITLECITILLIILFCYAAVSKLMDYQLFIVQLGKSPIVTAYATIISWTLPVAELMVAALLIFKATRLTGLFLSLFLMILFTTYIVIILKFSYTIPCSCGGILQGLSWQAHFVFNLFFLILIIIGIIIQSKETQAIFINAPLEPSITGEAENLNK